MSVSCPCSFQSLLLEIQRCCGSKKRFTHLQIQSYESNRPVRSSRPSSVPTIYILMRIDVALDPVLRHHFNDIHEVIHVFDVVDAPTTDSSVLESCEEQGDGTHGPACSRLSQGMTSRMKVSPHCCSLAKWSGL